MNLRNNPPPFKSRLWHYEKEIMKAWHERKTLKEIQQFLESQYNQNIPISTLGGFIKRRRNRPDPHSFPVVTPAKKTAPRKIDQATKEKLRELMEKDPLELRKENDRKCKISPLQEVFNPNCKKD